MNQHENGDRGIHRVREQSKRDKFFMIPNCVVTWPGMTRSAYHLYSWYKMFIGEDSTRQCWTSLTTISELLGMDRHTVITARDKLIEIGLITVSEERSISGRLEKVVDIVDIWAQNAKWVPPSRDADTPKVMYDCCSGEIPLDRHTVEKFHGGVENLHGTVEEIRGTVCEPALYKDPGITTGQEGKTVKLQTPVKPVACGVTPQQDGFAFSGEKKTVQPESYALGVAKRVADVLIKKNIVSMSNISLTKWSEDVRKFMMKNEYTREDIDPVLDWWIENIDERFTPNVVACKSFVDKFDALRIGMRRSKVPEKTNGHSDDDMMARVLERRRQKSEQK